MTLGSGMVRGCILKTNIRDLIQVQSKNTLQILINKVMVSVFENMSIVTA